MVPHTIQRLRGAPKPLEFYRWSTCCRNNCFRLLLTAPLRAACRESVSRNRPVIIEHAIDDWPALSKWYGPALHHASLRGWLLMLCCSLHRARSNDYLRQKLGDRKVTVDITPDGFGDAVKPHKGKQYFVTPLEV
jgi:hypothetical protein